MAGKKGVNPFAKSNKGRMAVKDNPRDSKKKEAAERKKGIKT